MRANFLHTVTLSQVLLSNNKISNHLFVPSEVVSVITRIIDLFAHS